MSDLVGNPENRFSHNEAHITLYLSENLNLSLTFKAPNTAIAKFTNTADPDETAHNEPSHLDLQCLLASLLFFSIIQFLLKVFSKFCKHDLSSAFLALYELRYSTSLSSIHVLHSVLQRRGYQAPGL